MTHFAGEYHCYAILNIFCLFAIQSLRFQQSPIPGNANKQLLTCYIQFLQNFSLGVFQRLTLPASDFVVKVFLLLLLAFCVG